MVYMYITSVLADLLVSRAAGVPHAHVELRVEVALARPSVEVRRLTAGREEAHRLAVVRAVKHAHVLSAVHVRRQVLVHAAHCVRGIGSFVFSTTYDFIY